MVSADQNDLLTLVEKPAPLYEIMRQYWQPAVRSASLEPDGAPVRVRLLGENYVAFRATDGRVGFFDEACPHRRASLMLARNEECGLRCLYHGWKIDVSGKVVETPNEPSSRVGFAEKVAVSHFPAREAGGLVWVWIGDGEPSPFPDLEFNNADPADVWVGALPTDCNWLQTVEGNTDAAHAGVLHATSVMPGRDETAYLVAVSAPEWEVHQSAWGLSLAASRDLQDGRRYVRVNEIVFPNIAMIALAPTGERMAIMALPVDNEHCIQWFVFWTPDGALPRGGYSEWHAGGVDENRDNGRASIRADEIWCQDRDAMRRGSFTGLRSTAIEDLAVFESMGSVVDRSKEHLGSSDKAVIALRRLVLEAIDSHRRGDPLPGKRQALDYASIVGRSYVVEKES